MTQRTFRMMDELEEYAIPEQFYRNQQLKFLENNDLDELVRYSQKKGLDFFNKTIRERANPEQFGKLIAMELTEQLKIRFKLNQ